MPSPTIHDAALSGGGNRAAASGAVFARALARHGVWGKLREAYGVSGGTWFLIMLARGRLKGVDLQSCTLDELLAVLQTAGITAQLTAAEQLQLTTAISKGAAAVSTERSGRAPESKEIASCSAVTASTATVPTGALAAAVAGAGVTAFVKSAVSQFGTGAGVAVSPKPIDRWAEHLRQALLGVSAAVEYYPDADEQRYRGPVLSVCAVSPRPDAPGYAWLKLGLQPANQIAAVFLPSVQPTLSSDLDVAQFSSLGVTATPEAAARTHEALSERGTLIVQDDDAIELGRLAAICGSAFAFDFGYVLDAAGIRTFAPGTLLPRVTVAIPFVTETAKSVSLDLRDAGIDHNVPYLPSTSGRFASADAAPAVLWVHDASAGCTIERSIQKAVLLGHFSAPFAPVCPTQKEVGEGTRWQLFLNADSTTVTEPRVIVQVMGLTDDETMEPSSTERRRADLVALNTELDAALPVILNKLAQLGLW